MVHLVPFASKFVNCLSHTEPLKIRDISCIHRFCFNNNKTLLLTDSSKTQCDSNNWPIGMQNICLMQTAGRQIFVPYICKVDVFFLLLSVFFFLTSFLKVYTSLHWAIMCKEIRKDLISWPLPILIIFQVREGFL